MLGLRSSARAFSSCGKRGPLFISVRRPLTIVASLVAEHKLQTRRLSSCGSRAQLLRGMWDLPRQGLEPMSPALAGNSQPLCHQGSPTFFFLQLHSTPLCGCIIVYLANSLDLDTWVVSTILWVRVMLNILFFLNKFFYFLFIYYFWLSWVFVAARSLSLVVASGGYSSLCAGFL